MSNPKLYALYSPSGGLVAEWTISNKGSVGWMATVYLTRRFAWARKAYSPNTGSKQFHAERRRRGWKIHRVEVVRKEAVE